MMNANGTWTVLSNPEIEQIREAAYSYVERSGFVVQHKGLLAKANARGASVDEASGRVRVSRALCAELMAQVPSRYTIRNMLGETWEIGGGAPHGMAIVTDPWIIDYDTKSPRRPCLEDLRRHTIIADQSEHLPLPPPFRRGLGGGLEGVAGVSRMDFPVTDVEGPTSSLRALEAHLLESTRHYQIMAADLESFDMWRDILRLLSRGGCISGLASAGIAVQSPLMLNELNGDLLLRAIEEGFAVVPTICPMAGSTAPYSLIGTLLASHVENLMMALLAQVVRPGSVAQYAAGLSVTDMSSGNDLYYTMDKVLWKIASVQLSKAERMPVMAECGGTLVWRYDQQSGAEGMLFMLAALSSGADMLTGFGSCHNAVGMSAEMMVIHNAYLNAAKHLVRGIHPVISTEGRNPLQKAVESLERVGPGGQFLDDDLTIELLRSDEFFRDPIFDFSGGLGDSVSMLERAHERAGQLVADHKNRVPHDIRENLQRYFSDIYRRVES